MLDPELRAKVDALWDKFWAGGLANPLMAIDQMNYLIFLKHLEDSDLLATRRAQAAGEAYQSVFADAEDCRWSYWKNLKAEEMLDHIQQRVFPWLKQLAPENHAFTTYLRDAAFLIPKASLLVEAVGVIDDLAISDRNIDTQGDIYEYMLGKLGVAGQIGQFRTPRQIIRTMVELVAPRVGDVIIDAACGTAGFLIAAYQYIIEKGTSEEFLSYDEFGVPHGLVGDKLAKRDWGLLRNGGLVGFDFDPTMVRIAAMNMVLHGIGRPKVSYADALGKAFSHAPRANVILANPPFSGSVDESDISDEFSVTTKSTELLFLELFMDLLLPGGRAAIIVPEGVVLGSDRATRRVRELLLTNNDLQAVVSLPHWIFKPYASVATFILVFSGGGTTERTWMYELRDDGFSRDGVREQIDANDLPDLIEQWGLRLADSYEGVAGRHGWVELDRLTAHDFELAPRRYLRAAGSEHRYPTAQISELCTITRGKSPAKKTPPGAYPFVTTAAEMKTANEYSFEGEAVCVPLVSSTGHGHASMKRVYYVDGQFAAASIVAVLQVKQKDRLLPRYLFHYLQAHKDVLLVPLMRGAANVALTPTKIAGVRIPLPTIEEQLALIDRLEDLDAQASKLDEKRLAVESAKAEALAEFAAEFAPELEPEAFGDEAAAG